MKFFEAHIYQSRQGSSCSQVFGLTSTARLTNCLWIVASKAPSIPPFVTASWQMLLGCLSPDTHPLFYLLLSAIRWPALHSRTAHCGRLYPRGCWKPETSESDASNSLFFSGSRLLCIFSLFGLLFKIFMLVKALWFSALKKSQYCLNVLIFWNITAINCTVFLFLLWF